MIGTHLLHYEIQGHLGTGGMGEVYRAVDTRLGRSVAIKVLPETVTHDVERTARFEREGRLLASLNHPNIAALYGLETIEQRLVLVMEFVEGETLAQRIAGGAVPVESALSIARQIAEALEAAHEKGVIHRDLKPANVKVTPEGNVKVLDFGLAKAMDPIGPQSGPGSLTHSPTLSLAATLSGVILGTAAYMAPEQAKGLATDQRSDVFAFGCVFYELLTGRQAFLGDTVTEVLASVIKSEPDFTLLPGQLSPRVTELIRRCLAKDPKRRWHAAADLRMELEAAMAEPRVAMGAQDRLTAPLWRRAVPFAATALVAASSAVALAWFLRPAVPASIARFSIVLPDGQALTRTGRHNIAVSPDGQSVVYVADNQLYLRAMGEVEARPIAGTNQDVNTPFFSPDGVWIGFYAVPEAKLKKIAVTGGASVTIADVTNPFGARWGADDTILVGQGPRGIVRVSASGGMPEEIIKVESGEFAHGPQMLPDGDHVLFTLARETGAARWDQADVVVQSLRSGDRRVLVAGGSDARYVPTGHLVYALGQNLLAVPFDEQSRAVTGGPVPIVEGIGRALAVNTAAMFFSYSANGTLAYFTGGAGAETIGVPALVDRTGRIIKQLTPPRGYADPRVSPDARQLAITVRTENDSNIWIYDLAGALAPRRLTFGGSNGSPAWSPDGRHILFVSTRDNNVNAIFRQAADGSGAAERLTDPQLVQPTAVRPAPDGKRLFFSSLGNEESIWMLSLESNKQPERVFDGPVAHFEPTLSPDGRWLAYSSSESGRSEVYVQPFPPTGAKYQVTTTQAHDPLWSPDGRQLFFLEHESDVAGDLHRLMSVDVTTASGFSVANPTRILDGVWDLGSGWAYDVTPDGRQFLHIRRFEDVNEAKAPNPEIRVTLNWFEELRRRVPR